MRIFLVGLGYLYMPLPLETTSFHLLNGRLFQFLTRNFTFKKHSLLLQWFDSSKSASILEVAHEFLAAIICQLFVFGTEEIHYWRENISLIFASDKLLWPCHHSQRWPRDLGSCRNAWSAAVVISVGNAARVWVSPPCCCTPKSNQVKGFDFITSQVILCSFQKQTVSKI